MSANRGLVKKVPVPETVQEIQTPTYATVHWVN